MTGELRVAKFCLRKFVSWKIPNFFSLTACVDSSVDSPPFAFANTTWCLRLYPNGKTDCESEGFVGLTIVRLGSSVPDRVIVYSLALPDGTGKYQTFMSSSYFKEKCVEVGNPRLLKRSQILAARDRFTPEDTVSMLCQLRAVKETVLHASSQADLPASNLETLSQNFKNLLLGGQDHDLTLQVKDKEFRVHQNVLRARSQVFGSMLSHDMIEKNSGVISLPDCDPIAFKQFLLYLYSGKVETLDENNMLGLYYIADKYDTADLKEECRRFVKNALSSRVICDVIQFALNHSDSNLLACATYYFVENVNEILPTVEWQSFIKANPTQANELFIKTSNKWSGDKKT